MRTRRRRSHRRAAGTLRRPPRHGPRPLPRELPRPLHRRRRRLTLRPPVCLLAVAALVAASCATSIDPRADTVFRIGVVAPSSAHDSSFTESMARALAVLDGTPGIETQLTDSTPIVSEAAVALRGYARNGYDLVVAHGSQYGGLIREMANEFPNTSFALGTAPFPVANTNNVFSYTVRAGEGGCVAGAIAGMLTETDVIGAVLPHRIGDAAAWADGFVAGAAVLNPDAEVRVRYIGSFTNTYLASDSARSQINNGADVLTGSAQLVAGAVGTAAEHDVPWLGNQSNQTALAPSVVVVSHVYHWEVLLRQMLGLVQGGILGSQDVLVATLTNGGANLAFNPDYPLDPGIRDAADAFIRTLREPGQLEANCGIEG